MASLCLWRSPVIKKHFVCEDNIGGAVNLKKCPSSCGSSSSNSSNKNETSGASHHSSKTYLGYIGAIIAILFFGSNFVPVKTYETGDGEAGRETQDAY